MRFTVALWSALVLTVSTVPVSTGYRSAWALPVLCVCAVAPFGVVALGRRLGVPAWTIATAGTLLGVVASLLVLNRVEDSAAGWRSAPAASMVAPLLDSVPRLLTAPRPAPPDPEFLVPAALLVWLTALTVALIVVGRRQATASPLVGAVVLHTAGALLTAGRGDTQGFAALLTAAVLLLGWAWLPSGQPRRTAPGKRRLPLLATACVGIIATFAVAAVVVSPDRAFEPRTLVPPPQLPVAATNPVPDLAAWTARPDEDLFGVQSTDGSAMPRRLTLVVLPDFDGAAWRIEARLRPVGVVEEPDLPLGTRQRTLSYVVQPEGLRGVWLPSAGRARAVSGDALMDVDTGVLVMPTGLSAHPITVESTVSEASEFALARAAVPPYAEATRYLDLPRFPHTLREEALDITAGLESRWEQALALEAAVRGERLLDHQAPSGSSYGRIQELLFAPEAEGGQVGSTEQFAAAFAMLGRAVGLPTRLVVGFDLGRDAAESGDDVWTVRGANARAWAEVYFARVGWVAFDPSPDTATDVDRPRDTPEIEPEVEPTTPSPTDATEEPTDEAIPESARTPGVSWPFVTGLVLAVAVLAVLLLATLLAVRRRLAWRRAGSRGAWALILRSLHVAGRPAPPDRAAPQAAQTVAEPAREAAMSVAGRAERDAFGPPGGEQGDGYWRLARDVETVLRRDAPWWRRVGWWIWPR